MPTTGDRPAHRRNVVTTPIDLVPDPSRVVEAILMVATEPVPTSTLASLVDLAVEEIDQLCRDLASALDGQVRGYVLVEVAGGWRFQSHPDLAPYIERFVLEGQGARLSAAALETLAIIAYKQPISRAQVAAIRGVSVDGVIRTLEGRGYIGEVSRDPGPGQAVLFGTTPAFLEKLGLATLSDLPPVADFVPDATVVEQLEEGLRPHPPLAGQVNAESHDQSTASRADTPSNDDTPPDVAAVGESDDLG